MAHFLAVRMILSWPMTQIFSLSMLLLHRDLALFELQAWTRVSRMLIITPDGAQTLSLVCGTWLMACV